MTSDPLRSDNPSYLPEDAGAIARLQEEVMRRIDTQGSISFPEYLSVVLYDERDGYYARPHQRRTGREGDFFTAVSVGDLFGTLMAEHARKLWLELGSPARFRIVEWGSEDGQLARDVLSAVGDEDDFGQALTYAVIEPLAGKREALAAALPGVQVVAEPAELDAVDGMVLANELIDAIPFWLVRREEGRWLEKRVAIREGDFAFELAEPAGELAKLLSSLPAGLPDGYESEVRVPLQELLAGMAGVLRRGEVVLPDYGFEQADYYHPERRTGTLQTYGKHRRGEDPLVAPGALDITAHVDWTRLAEEGAAVGLTPEPLLTQGRFLTLAGEELLRARDGQVDPGFVRQFMTLTHPAQLGTKFQVQRFRKGLDGVSDTA
ncbi:MAG: SAM-dependent methyltransferase [Verrucomicrobiota bacterium JB023]|nr:SAM-dependent methyltransferase [Verrucomicrobiota bacterium JB023]